MFNNFPSAHEEESYPYIPEEQDLGTPASLESKLTFKLHLDALLGSLEDGTLELNEYGSDGFDCVIDDYEISLGTEENVRKQGGDYCMYIGENVFGEDSKTSPGERSYDTYLIKKYYLMPEGTFKMTMHAEFDDSEYEDTKESGTNRPMDYQTRQAVDGYRLVTEGEAQELIQMLSEIVEAQG